MGRVYTVQFSAVAVTEDQDLFEISPADDKPVKILGLFLSQNTELADAQEEQLPIQVIRGYTASGSGGSAGAAVPIDPSSPAAGFASEVNNTTIANTGTAVIIHSESFNVRVGQGHYWTPETAPMANQGNTTIVVRLMTNPADSVTMNGTLYVEEL